MSQERFNAQMFVSWYAEKQGVAIEELGVAPVVVLSWSREIIRSLADNTGAVLSNKWMYKDQYPMFTGEVDGNRVSFLFSPVGAPGTVMFMEEFISCGASVIIGLGAAGSLQPEAPVGTFIIPTDCISEEGTSDHYIDRNTDLYPSRRLVEIIRKSCERDGHNVLSGSLWTTDAPYREFVNKIEEYRKRGILGVDMETSAMYALGSVRGVDVCNLLVVSDELWHEWRPEFGSPELQEKIRCAERVILRCVADGVVCE